MKSQNAEKILKIVKNVFVSIVVVFSVFMMIFTIVSVTMFDKNERDVFGYKFFIVQSDSMKATHFDIYDLIISKEVDPNTLDAGDIVTFMSVDQKSGTNGMIITHMIREKLSGGENPRFQTYGTTTGSDDPFQIDSFQILGEYQFKIPYAGPFFRFLKTVPGYIVCILIPFMLLILSQGINFIKIFRQYKMEQTAEIQAEREKVDAERLAAQKELAEAQKMMEELRLMREMMAQQNAQAAEPVQTTDEATPSAESENKVQEAVEDAAVESVTEQAEEPKAIDEAVCDNVPEAEEVVADNSENSENA